MALFSERQRAGWKEPRLYFDRKNQEIPGFSTPISESTKADVTWLSCDCTDFSALGLSGQDIIGGLAPQYA